MVKKIFVPVILALIAALAFSNVVYAANKPSAHVYHIKGSVVGVNTYAMTIRVATPQGKLTINLDSHTVYKGIISSLSELTPGMVVNVRAKLLPNHEYLAEVVNALRSEKILQIDGQVTSISLHAMTFTILGTDGNTYTFLVKAKTTFKGHRVTNLSGLRTGMQVTISYMVMSDGRLRAVNVAVTGT
jgi:hypothetical protein